VRFSTTDNKETDTMTREYKFRIDGYGPGDRMLEDVYFDVTVEGDESGLTVKTVAVVPDSAKYFETLNKEYWLKEIREWAEEQLDDVLGMVAKGKFTLADYLDPENLNEDQTIAI
jgi:hypothetical protein